MTTETLPLPITRTAVHAVLYPVYTVAHGSESFATFTAEERKAAAVLYEALLDALYPGSVTK